MANHLLGVRIRDNVSHSVVFVLRVVLNDQVRVKTQIYGLGALKSARVSFIDSLH